MSFKPSKYQAAIFHWIETGVGNGIVEAVAGSGKTTTIIQAMEHIPSNKRVCFLAFNKSIAEELKKKVPPHCDAMTLNGLGHRAWMRHVASVKLDAHKTTSIVNEALTEAEVKAYGYTVKRIVGLAKAYGLVPKGIEGAEGVIEDTDQAWLNIIEHHDIDLGTEYMEEDEIKEVHRTYLGLCRRVLSLSCEQKTLIDFDDQLYLTTIYKAAMPKYDWVFVDEAQDLNGIQLAMLQLMAGKNCRVVAIGDSRQAIYGFRGAGTDSMGKFELLFHATKLDLSISYRCPSTHVALAQEIVPQIEAAENAIAGTVTDLGKEWKTGIFVNTDLVICRANAPLVRMAYQLLADRVPVRILGRDIGAGLVSLIKRLKAKDLDELFKKLVRWHEREVDKLLQKDPEANTDKIDDKFEAIKVFIDMFPEADPDELCREIESIYSDNTKGILTLCTVHKAKGLEAERVYILDSWYLGPRKAKKGQSEPKAWQKQQELNLKYVALTRSKKDMVFILSQH